MSGENDGEGESDEICRRSAPVERAIDVTVDVKKTPSQEDVSDVVADTIEHVRSDTPSETVDGRANQLRGKRFGDYELLEEIARGGMGVVYKACQTQLNRTVALKMILSGQFAGDAEVLRFQAEAEAAANLQHPGIVPIYEVGYHGGHHFFSMGFIEGTTLSATIKDGPIGNREAAELLAKVGIAIAYAHQQGVIHRDLKPGNILIGGDAQPLVADFGLAKRTDTDSGLTGTGQVVGTPSYMAPEQAAAKADEVGTLVDVYSLGAILYCLLTGRPPFHAANVMDTLMQVIDQEPVPPRQLNPTVDRDLETICLKCLLKEQSKRYQSADALVDDLQHWLNGEPIAARPAGRLERTWRWCKRNPMVAGPSAAAVMLLLVGLAVSISLSVVASRREADAQANLYRSLVRETESLRLARIPGFRVRAWERLNQAIGTGTPDIDLQELRQEAVACMGDFMGLEPAVFNDFPAQVCSLAISSPLNTVAVGMLDGTVSMRNIMTGVESQRLRGNVTSQNLVCVHFDSTGTSLLTATTDGMGLIWKRDTAGKWNVVTKLETGRWNATKQLATTPDLKYVVTGSGDSVFIGDLGEEGRKRTLKVPGRVRGVSIRPDARKVTIKYMSEKGMMCQVWDVVENKESHLFALGEGLGGFGNCVFSGNGRLWAACGMEGVTLHETSSFRQIGFRRGHMCSSVGFSADSSRLAFGSIQEASVRMWRLSNNEHDANLTHPGRPKWLSYSGDGRRLASATEDSVRIWSLASPERLELKAHRSGATSAVFTDDGKQLISISKDRSVKVFDSETGNVLLELELADLGQCLALHPNQRILATGGFTKGVVQLWDLKTGSQLAVIDKGFGTRINGVPFSPDGKLFAIGGKGGLQIFRVAVTVDAVNDSVGLSLEPIEDGPSRDSTAGYLRFRDDNLILAWASDSGTIRIWDLVNSRELDSPGTVFERVHSLAFFSNDSRLFYLDPDRRAVVWDTESAQELSSFPVAKNKDDSVATYSAYVGMNLSGNQLAISSMTGHGVNIWDVEKQELLLALPERSGTVWRMLWSPDGNRLAVTRSNGDLAIWNVAMIRSQLADLGLDW